MKTEVNGAIVIGGMRGESSSVLTYSTPTIKFSYFGFR
jgi:hypothetical protein